MTHRYSVRFIDSDVRVFSNGQYSFKVFFNGTPWIYRNYSPGFYIDDWANAPKYIYREIRAEIVDAINGDKLKFCECDRDGWKRWTNLRYHDLDYLKAQFGIISFEDYEAIYQKRIGESNS